MKELEEARRAAEEASKSKSEFLSNMSHDIRTPMNAIVGMTSIAAAHIDDPQQVQNCLKKITLSSKHLLGLINDVLDMSKIESGKMTLNVELVSLREVMDSIVTIVQPQVKAKHQNFNISIYNIMSENVHCDSVRLNQIMLNLLSNAIKFTPEGGSIEVVLHEDKSPRGEDHVRSRIHVIPVSVCPKSSASISLNPLLGRIASVSTRSRALVWAWLSPSTSWMPWAARSR